MIAVEIKGFIGSSAIRDFETAIGQFLIYRLLLSKRQPERKLYLAITDWTLKEVFDNAIIQLVIREFSIPLLVIDQFAVEVLQWNA